MITYRDGVAQPEVDLTVVEALRAHEWNAWTAGCGCGWSQRENLGRRWARTNHAAHLAAAIARQTRSEQP